jgi:hypothetical protein
MVTCWLVADEFLISLVNVAQSSVDIMLLKFNRLQVKYCPFTITVLLQGLEYRDHDCYHSGCHFVDDVRVTAVIVV